MESKLSDEDLIHYTVAPDMEDEDLSEEDDIDVEELERRMERDRMKLKRIKDCTKTKDGSDRPKHKQSQVCLLSP